MNQLVLCVLLSMGHHFLHGQSAGSTQSRGSIVLQLEHMAGGKPLYLDSTYSNSFGEQYQVTKFRYYISHIILSKNNFPNNNVVIDTTFLVDEKDPDSKHILLRVPIRDYDRLSFIIGVDSARNVSGAQGGVLDPQQDMFWTWKSGYVMAKLEGSSTASKLPRRMFEYHIGGCSGMHSDCNRLC